MGGPLPYRRVGARVTPAPGAAIGPAVLAALGLAVLAMVMGLAGVGHAQAPLPHEDEALARRSRAAVDDASFGPMLVIEDIEVAGNDATPSGAIRRALPLAPGDRLRAGDPRFQKARYKLLATGYFRTVELGLRKGSEPGRVVLTVTVEERGTVILNELHFGVSAVTPWWGGLDLGERNLLGTGIGVSGGVVYGAAGDVAGAAPQWAAELRIDKTDLLGSAVGMHGALLHTRASEAYRVQGDPETTAASDFRVLPYARTGARGGVGMDLTPLSRLSVDARVEHVDATVPDMPVRDLPDGSSLRLDPALVPGESWVISARVGFDRDTRPDPVLPFAGDRLLLLGEIGAGWMGSDYDFAVLLGRYERWWPVRGRQHVLSVHVTGGLVLGDAPRFDRLHAADLSPLLTPRAFGLVLSTAPLPDVLGTGAVDATYGNAGGSAMLEYTFRLFRSRRHIYGGDLFLGAGLWAMAAARGLDDDGDAITDLVVDLMLDAGLRIDTEIGIFELTLANGLGRIPL